MPFRRVPARHSPDDGGSGGRNASNPAAAIYTIPTCATAICATAICATAATIAKPTALPQPAKPTALPQPA